MFDILSWQLFDVLHATNFFFIWIFFYLGHFTTVVAFVSYSLNYFLIIFRILCMVNILRNFPFNGYFYAFSLS